jgi:hypothetical protein
MAEAMNTDLDIPSGGESLSTTPLRTQSHITWAAIVGIVLVALAIVFFMVLIVASVVGHTVPCDSRMLVVFLLGLVCAVGTAFWGGDAVASGQINLPEKFRFLEKPVVFSATGGVVVFIIVLSFGYGVYSCNETPPSRPHVSDANASLNESGRLDVIVRYSLDSLSSRHKLFVQFLTSQESEELLIPEVLVDDWKVGQVWARIRKPQGGNLFVRLIIRDDTGGKVVSRSSFFPVEVPHG